MRAKIAVNGGGGDFDVIRFRRRRRIGAPFVNRFLIYRTPPRNKRALQ